jgi:photosystem II stability/assembly factor-like uncharacterized protein
MASGQWVQTNGPWGGYVTALAENDKAVFAWTVSGGISRSTDNGASWKNLNFGKGSEVYFLSGYKETICAVTALSNGVSVSTDNGENWVEENKSIGCGSFCSFASNGKIVLPYKNNILLSSDGGVTWIERPLGVDRCRFLSLAVHDSTIIVSAIGKRLFRSVNDGMNWSEQDSGYIPEEVTSLAINDGAVFAKTYKGLYFSTDNGNSWAAGAGLINRYICCLAVEGHTIFAGSNAGAFRSTNNGGDWASASSGISCLFVNSLAMHNGILFAGTDQGVFRSTNLGAQWTAAGSGIISPQTTHFTSIGNAVIAGTRDGIFRTTNEGADWSNVGSDIPISSRTLFQGGEPTSSLYAGSGAVFASIGYGKGDLVRSTDSGASWQLADSGIKGIFVRSFAESGNHIFAGTLVTEINQPAIYFSTDNGRFWVHADSIRSPVRSLAFCENTLLAMIDGLPGFWLTHNNGTSWTTGNAGSPIGSYLTALDNKIFSWVPATGEMRPFISLSTDCGTTWTAIDSGLPSGETAFAASAGYAFAGVYKRGIYLSTNNGKTWSPVNSGLPDSAFARSLGVSGGKLYADIYTGNQTTPINHGIWRRSIPEMAASLNTIPYRTLSQPIYSGMTVSHCDHLGLAIQMFLPARNRIAIQLFDLRGREIRFLLDKFFGPGTHQFLLDARNVAKGCYFLRMMAGESISAKKITFDY